jgi:UDP-2,4-diacetamido-2,4,6-trideoxy-beta-L-altropyranose hydrolase
MHSLVADRGYLVANLPVTATSSQESDAVATAHVIREHFLREADWLVVDNYTLDACWENAMRSHARHLMVVDDLANRPHDCDLLLDQNYYRDLTFRYDGLLPDYARCLLGPEYILLRPEFSEARHNLRQRDGVVRRILVFFGGSDPLNITGKVLQALEYLQPSPLQVDVVVGGANPHREDIRTFCENHTWASYRHQISNMAELIATADLGIGAGGASMWERCALGLPTLTVVFAENQLHAAKDVAETGAILYLGWADSLSIDDYRLAVQNLLDNPTRLRRASEAALDLVKTSDEPVADAIWNWEE